MFKPLLPPNTTDLERKLAEVLASCVPVDFDLGDSDIIRAIHHPEHCPSDLLPYLAWALSVDYWNEEWSDELKRRVIQSAWTVHKHKGTRWAIEQLIASFGYRVTITEFWENGGAAGTFSLSVDVIGKGIDADTETVMTQLIEQSKPVSRHLTKLTISQSVAAKAYACSATACGDITTVYPYQPEIVQTHAAIVAASALHCVDIVTIHPGS